MVVIETLIAFSLVLLLPFLVYKAVSRRDLTIVASIIPRIYLLIAVILDISDTNLINQEMIHIGVLITFTTDIITNMIYVLTKKWRTIIENQRLLEALQSLQDKYTFLVEHSPLGKFVVNSFGRVEFANKALGDLVELPKEELINKSIFDFVPYEDKDKLTKEFFLKVSGEKDESDYFINILTMNGKKVKVRVIAKRTFNSHLTITGTVIPVRED